MKIRARAVAIALLTLTSLVAPSARATSTPGVTDDEIRVVLYNDLGISGDMSTPWKPSDDPVTDSTSANRRDLVRTIKGLRRFFMDQFNTYGRSVRIIAQRSVGSSCAGRAVDADLAVMEYAPFAAVTFSDDADCYAQTLAEQGVMTFGAFPDAKASTFEDNKPYVWSFMPDRETETAWGASFLCKKLAGLPARFSPDPLLGASTRRFGIIVPVWSSRGSTVLSMALNLRADAQSACGIEIDPQYYDASLTIGSGSKEATQIMAHFRLNNTTTLICYCNGVDATVTTMQTAATALGYFPEWYWDAATRLDKPAWQQAFGNRAQRSFGTTYYALQPEYSLQYPSEAYRYEEPATTPNQRWIWYIYHSFLTLFTGIQNAGPDLTPQNVATGMPAFSSRDLTNPSITAGGFDDGGPSPHTFIDTAAGWWWDPTAQEPGSSAPLGCMRLIDEGHRSYAGTWSTGNADLFNAGDPCTYGPHPIPILPN